MRQRLHKFMAACGIASRRASEMSIRQGKVAVNGQVVTTLGMLIDPEKDVVTVGQRTITPQQRRVYLALNKPEGCIVSLRDTHGRPTVHHLIRRIPARLFPVGRLDMNSEGLLLMTNDGELAYRLTHPRFGIEKEYRATVQGMPDAVVLERLRRGIELDGGLTAPATVRVIKSHGHTTMLSVIIHEGRKRQIRRMFAAVGYPVCKLKRIRVGSVRLGRLPVGRYRQLKPREVESLRRLVQLE